MFDLNASLIILAPLGAAYLLLYAWKRERQNLGNPPVRGSMLRPPGESLRIRIADLNDSIQEKLILLVFPPITLTAVYFILLGYKAAIPLHFEWVLTVLSSVFVVSRFWGLRRLLEELKNCELGFAGERLVAEHLTPLIARGFDVFHDVPAGAHGNIDHVVVTPTTVYAIETKTYRKPLAWDGKLEIVYNGKQVCFPGRTHSFHLDQVRRQARWLESELIKALDQGVAVRPVLVYPGWSVVCRSLGDVHVLNSKQVISLIDGPSTASTLEGARVANQIRAWLDNRCRDVAFSNAPWTKKVKRDPSKSPDGAQERRRPDTGPAVGQTSP